MLVRVAELDTVGEVEGDGEYVPVAERDTVEEAEAEAVAVDDLVMVSVVLLEVLGVGEVLTEGLVDVESVRVAVAELLSVGDVDPDQLSGLGVAEEVPVGCTLEVGLRLADGEEVGHAVAEVV